MAFVANIGGDGSLFVGEDKEFQLDLVDLAGVPVDMTGWSIVFDVRRADNSADPAIFTKTATIQGVYSAVVASNSQRAVVVLTDAELNTISARTYRHSWKRTDEDGETVLAWGNFTPQKATAP
jgi:hypothetical protein